MITRKIVNTKQQKVIAPNTDQYYDSNSGEHHGSLEALVEDIDEIAGGDYFSFKFNNKSIQFNVEQLPYCCGILELGELSAAGDVNIPDLIKFLDLIVNQQKGITYMINTNGKGDSIIFEKALAKCKNWICVKQFKNANSNNIISMWVSKNE